MSSVEGDYRHPAIEAIATINGGLDELAAASLWSLTAPELADLVVEAEKISRRIAAAQLPLLAQVDTTGLAYELAATSTPAWLRNVADVPYGVGKARLRLHRSLGSRPVAAAAFAAGEINLDVTTAVCGAIEALPPEVPAALATEVEELLVSTGRDEGTRAVYIRAAEITHRFAPEVLEEAEERARQDRWLTLTQRHDGTVGVRGVLDKEAGALALAVLEPLAAPEPAVDGMPDFRGAARRYADGFYRLCQLATPNLPDVRGERPNVLLMVGLDTVQQHRPSSPGRLAGGQVLSGAASRRVTCDANLIAVLLDTLGQPLDIGRATRVVPTPIRRALIARDRGCAFPGCDRPPSWCDAHHIDHWSAGGATALCNLCLLCTHHHNTVHHDGWDIEMIGGMPWFVPPRWIDADRTPRQNSRYKVAQLRT
ncbi:MAG TPA: DUF222 domain-containing protein [Acidothermaceae bacterium]|nr:DUF222 domain-containing protein [Acidothermaceae bacterium]